jgi:hypothetical protein
MLVLVGAHYLPFVFLYGMPAFAALAAVLVAAGVTLAGLFPSAPFAAGAWVGAGALLLWAALGRWLADREAGA